MHGGRVIFFSSFIVDSKNILGLSISMFVFCQLLVEKVLYSQ